MKDYKIGKYCFIWEGSQGYFVFDLLNQNLLLLDFDPRKINELDEEALNLLIENSIISLNIDNEIEFMKSIINYEQKQMKRLTLWLYLTFDCNMYCYYCYDMQLKRRKKFEMDKKVINSIKKWILKINQNYDYIDIVLFGGEPLLKIKLIKYLNKIMRKKFDNKVNLSIITNGYLLTQRNIILLKKLNVNQYQITIDGYEKTHDARRKAINGGGTYNVIMNNINKLLLLNSEAHITIRINIDDNNKNSIMEFLTNEVNILKDSRIVITFAKVREAIKGELQNHIISDNDYLQIYDELTMYCFNNGIDVAISELSSCSRKNNSKFCFDSEGNIYKCNNSVGDHNFIIGNTMLNQKEITHDFIFKENLDENCKKCCFIRYCMGGCIFPFFKEKKDIEIGMKSCYKKYFEKLVKIHYTNKYNCEI